MTDPVQTLPAPAPARIAAALDITRKAETAAAGDPAFPDAAQSVYNAVLTALPGKPHPVFYGLLSRDISDTPLPSDIVIYGYRLNDPVARTAPVVSYDRQEIPSVVVEDVRLDVTLPDDVKKAIGFAPGPCDSRASFGLRVRGSYHVQRGVWPVVWSNEFTTSADLYALPSPVVYAAQVVTTTQAATVTVTNASFSRKSELASADCGEERRVSVDVPLPAGAKNVQCQGEWVDASGDVKRASRCVVSDGAAHVSGELTGGVRVCSPDKLCTCPNSAQGFLEARGSYQILEAEREVKAAPEAAPAVFPAGGSTETTVTVPAGRKLRHVALSLSRRACPTPLDALDLNIGDDPESRATAVSKAGAFRASLTGDRLRVGSADAFAADVGKTP
jgi:hypothetical protein